MGVGAYETTTPSTIVVVALSVVSPGCLTHVHVEERSVRAVGIEGMVVGIGSLEQGLAGIQKWFGAVGRWYLVVEVGMVENMVELFGEPGPFVDLN